MTTHEYGYLYNPPDWQEGDEWEPEPGHWIKERKEIFDHGYPRRRLIKPGDGYRIVPKAEFGKMQTTWPLAWHQTTDGVNWHVGYPSKEQTILAVRVALTEQTKMKGDDVNATKAPEDTKGAKESMKAKSNYRDPLPEELTTPEFEAVWKEIKRWDINVPDQYAGYCGATGNHVMAILNALKPVLAMLAQSQQPKFCGEWIRTKQGESVEYEVEYFSDGKGYDWKLQYFPKPPAPIVEKKEEFDLWWMDNHTTDVDSITARELAYMAWHAALQSKGVSSCCSDKKA